MAPIPGLSLFDVTMSANDRAEVCELAGTYMLSILSEKTKAILDFTMTMDWSF